MLTLTFLFYLQRPSLPTRSHPAAPWHQYPGPPPRHQRGASSAEPFHVYFTSVSFLKMQNIKALWSKALQFKGYRHTKGSVTACSVSALAMSELISAFYACTHCTIAASLPP